MATIGQKHVGLQMRFLARLALMTLLLAARLALAQQHTGVTAQAIGQANLRSDASIDSNLVGEINAGASYPVVGRSQFYPWILIGDPVSAEPIGWVYDALVVINGSLPRVPISEHVFNEAPPTITATSPAQIRATLVASAATKVTPATAQSSSPSFGVTGEIIGEVNIRYGPGVEYPRVGVANAGQLFEITGYHTQFPWVRIAFDGVPNNQAWIAKDLLRISGNLLNTPAVTQSRLILPPLTATPPRISAGAAGGEAVTLSTGFQILAKHLWNLVLEKGFDPQTSRFGALFVMDLQTGEAFSFGDEIAFSGTSINKIGILAALYQHLAGAPSIEIATDIANTMICSENVATNRLLSIVGNGNTYLGAEAVTEFYRQLGWGRSFISAPFTTIGTPEPPPKPIPYPQTSADQLKADPDLSNQLDRFRDRIVAGRNSQLRLPRGWQSDSDIWQRHQTSGMPPAAACHEQQYGRCLAKSGGARRHQSCAQARLDPGYAWQCRLILHARRRLCHRDDAPPASMVEFSGIAPAYRRGLASRVQLL